MTVEDKLHTFRLRVLQRAEALGNVSVAKPGSHGRSATNGGSNSPSTESTDCIHGEPQRVRDGVLH